MKLPIKRQPPDSAPSAELRANLRDTIRSCGDQSKRFILGDDAMREHQRAAYLVPHFWAFKLRLFAGENVGWATEIRPKFVSRHSAQSRNEMLSQPCHEIAAIAPMTEIRGLKKVRTSCDKRAARSMTERRC